MPVSMAAPRAAQNSLSDHAIGLACVPPLVRPAEVELPLPVPELTHGERA